MGIAAKTLDPLSAAALGNCMNKPLVKGECDEQ